MASLTIAGVHKRYGSTHILKGIDLSIADGEFLILVGPSGCGKSTLLNMIAGLDETQEGQIRIGDRVVNELGPKDRDIAMVFQSYALYPSMTVRQNIEFAMKMRKVPPAERAATVERVARTLQIEALLERRPSQLSGGQRQRVAMGRALARNPAIFLFDEPLSNLDAKLRVEMRAEIKSLHQRLKNTIVYVTHDQVEAMTLGDRIAVMKDGVVQQFGTPAEIYERPANRYVASFIGSPTMNFLPAAALPQALDGGLPRDAVAGIRPEHFTPCGAQEPGALPVQVQLLEPTGADTFATVRLGDHALTVRYAPRQAPAVGDQAWLRVEPDRVNLFDARTEQRLRA